MQTLLTEVKTELDKLTGVSVYPSWPASWVSLPIIAWREINNSVDSQADGVEYITLVEYAIDIWASTVEAAAALALLVDEKLAAINLRRTWSDTGFEEETGRHHKPMRYSAKISNSKIHQ